MSTVDDRHQAIPKTGTCAPWAQISDIQSADVEDLEQGMVNECLQIASDILFNLTAQRWAGACQDTVRPCLRTLAADYGRPIRPPYPFGGPYGFWPAAGMSMWAPSMGFWMTNRTDRDGGQIIPEITLGAYPVTGIKQILIDGVALPEYDPNDGHRNFRVDDSRWLVRLANPVTNANPGWPGCFAAGTLVLTAGGLKPIELIQEGDRVLTHRNRWRRVSWAGKTRDSETVTVAGRGGEVRCTPDHLFWAAEVAGGIDPSLRNRRSGKARQKLGAPEWVQASRLLSSAWATPTSIEALPLQLPEGWTERDLPPNFWWVIGRWLGDGWTSGGRALPKAPVLAHCPECGWSPRGSGGVAIHRAKIHGVKGSKNYSNAGVLICAGHHESEALAAELAATGMPWRRTKLKETVRWRLSNPALWTWLRQEFGTSAHNKRLPGWLLAGPETLRKELLAGYVSADGCNLNPGDRRRPITSIVTASETLAQGVRLLVAGLGFSPTLYRRRAHLGSIRDRVISGGPSFRVDWNDAHIGERFVQTWGDADHLWGHVRSIALDDETVPVYDLEVEEDHSFLANGFVVHNSQRMDLEATEKDTWEVVFYYGTPPPPGGKVAAAIFGYQIALSRNPATLGKCRLPTRVTQVTRQGMTAIVLDPMAFLKDGKVGLYEVDTWIESENPGHLRRPASVSSPDIQRRVRRTQPPNN